MDYIGLRDFPVELALIVLLVCFLIHIFSVEALKKSLSRKPDLYAVFFKKTSFVAIGIPRMELPSSLRLKYFIPFTVTTKKISGVELIYLYISRIAVWFGIVSLVCVFC